MKYPLPQITTEPGMATVARSAKQMYVPALESNLYSRGTGFQCLLLCFTFNLNSIKKSAGGLSWWGSLLLAIWYSRSPRESQKVRVGLWKHKLIHPFGIWFRLVLRMNTIAKVYLWIFATEDLKKSKFANPKGAHHWNLPKMRIVFSDGDVYLWIDNTIFGLTLSDCICT